MKIKNILLALMLTMPLASISQNNSSDDGELRTVPSGYTDLGLPSGTLWKNVNAPGIYTYDDAVEKFGETVPTIGNWNELEEECDFEWTSKGFKVTGPNGNYIILPATKRWDCDEGTISTYDKTGSYWTYNYRGSVYAYGYLISVSYGSGTGDQYRCSKFAIRQIHKKRMHREKVEEKNENNTQTNTAVETQNNTPAPTETNTQTPE